MLRTRTTYLLGIIAALSIASCSDDIFPTAATAGSEEGITFTMHTMELEQSILSGATRAYTAADFDATTTTFNETGGTTASKTSSLIPHLSSLSLQSLPYPAIGEHSTGTTATTRTAASGIASTDDFHDDISLWGHINDGTTLIEEQTLTRANYWRSGVRWPFEKTGTMLFHAIAPASSEVEGLTINSASYSALTLHYIVDEDRTNHRDLLYGTSAAVSIDTKTIKTDEDEQTYPEGNLNVDLSFRHILSAVRIAQGKLPEGWIITGVRIKGVKNEGSYDGSAWSSVTGNAEIPVIESESQTDGGITTWTSTIGSTHTSTAYSPGTNVFIDGGALFMMPQTLDGATLEADILIGTSNGTGGYTYEEKPHTITAALTGTWQSGFQYIYKITVGEISTDEYQIFGNNINYKHDTQAATQQLKVTSYRKFIDYSSSASGSSIDYNAYSAATGDDQTNLATRINAHAVKWKVEGVYSDASCETPDNPEWLTFQNSSAVTVSAVGMIWDGGLNQQKIKAAFSPQAYTNSYNHTETLKDNRTSSTSGGANVIHYGTHGIDLSKVNSNLVAYTSSETANCYIVNRAGQFCFPMVEGNTNTEVTGVDHVGILWQSSTSPALISIVSTISKGVLSSPYDNSTDYISFNINNADIQQGNALIAAYNSSDKILWTWHIWVTDQVLQNDNINDGKTRNSITLTNASGAGYDVMPVPLGWVETDAAYGIYSHRSAYLKLQQVDNDGDAIGSSAVVHIEQHAAQDLETGTCPFYQWGRFTPLPSDSSVTSKDITTVTEAVTYSRNSVRISGENYWFNTADNRWGGDATGTATTKSKYDPSPIGYKVAPSSVFTGLTRARVETNKSDYGAIFYTNDNSDDTQTIYIPNTGYWNCAQTEGTKAGKMNPSKGCFWTSDYDSAQHTKGYSLYIDPASGLVNESVAESNHIKFTDQHNNIDGLAVWPMKEE